MVPTPPDGLIIGCLSAVHAGGLIAPAEKAMERTFYPFHGLPVLIVYPPSAEPFGGFRRAVINDLAVPHIQTRSGFHIRAAQNKIPDVQVFLNAHRMDGLGDNHNAPLNVPAENNPRHTLFVPDGNGGQRFVGEDTEPALGKGTPTPAPSWFQEPPPC